MKNLLKNIKIKELDIMFLFFIASVCFLLLLSLVTYITTGEVDNIYEEAAESVIHSNTGLDVDFSPCSPE